MKKFYKSIVGGVLMLLKAFVRLLLRFVCVWLAMINKPKYFNYY